MEVGAVAQKYILDEGVTHVFAEFFSNSDIKAIYIYMRNSGGNLNIDGRSRRI